MYDNKRCLQMCQYAANGDTMLATSKAAYVVNLIIITVSSTTSDYYRQKI